MLPYMQEAIKKFEFLDTHLMEEAHSLDPRSFELFSKIQADPKHILSYELEPLLKVVKLITLRMFLFNIANKQANFCNFGQPINDLRPVFTGHPTEFCSDEVLHNLIALENFLEQEKPNTRSLNSKLNHLLQSKLTPEIKLTVEDEVKRNLFYMQNFAKFALDIPINSIHLRSWTAGDADGNYNITPFKMERAVNLHKAAAVKIYLTYLHGCQSVPPKAIAAIRDLNLQSALKEFPDPGLHKLCDIFGVSVAKIDIRQNMNVHSKVVAEIIEFSLEHLEAKPLPTDDEAQLKKLLKSLRYYPLMPKYAENFSETVEAERCALLKKLITNSSFIKFASQLFVINPPKTLPMVISDELLRIQVINQYPDFFENYIISNSEGYSSVLQLLLLLTISGARVNIVPLFETKSALNNAKYILAMMLACEVYRNYIKAKPQKIMLGYSDSEKYSGICVLPLISKTAKQLIAYGAKLGVEVEIFHGNGLDLGRGGSFVVAKEQTFQGNHIRYAFSSKNSLCTHLAHFAKETDSPKELTVLIEEGSKFFETIWDENHLQPKLLEYLKFASPYQLFIRSNNFSSRPSQRFTNDNEHHPLRIWFTDLIADDGNILKGLRAIPWMATAELTFTNFNLWLGFRQGLEAMLNKYDTITVKKNLTGSELLTKVLYGLATADFQLAKAYTEHEYEFLTFLEKEFVATQKLLTKLNFKLPELVVELLNYKNTVVYPLKLLMTHINRHVVYGKKSPTSLYAGITEHSMQTLVANIYLGLSEARIPIRELTLS
ncbi:MAG: phosphoenolpyruvate carboxylase [Rickettsiales bacterium]